MFIKFNRTSRAWWHLSQTRPPLRIKLPGPVRLQGQSSSLRVAGGRVFTPETKGGLFHHDPCLQLIHSENRLPYRFAGYNSSLYFFFSRLRRVKQYGGCGTTDEEDLVRYVVIRLLVTLPNRSFYYLTYFCHFQQGWSQEYCRTDYSRGAE